MLFIVSGKDHQNGIEARLKYRAQHRAHYEALGEDLILSGPYLDENGEPIGSMIVVRFEDQTAAEAYVQADPYVRENVFETTSVARWDWFMKRPEDLVT